ncbi:imm11 family protein [Cerasicoccus frondis]|uniref:imm11 family protein n=1 Tax=Cerasicoccus frondis TaxID=490090 RepID=UPI00285251D8|nr:DUF1629 domain-containing protein [Cerasicoccus frondis]
MSIPNEIYELEKRTDHPLFEGFALPEYESVLGRDDLDEDLTPGYEASEEQRVWKVPLLSHLWKKPKVIGRVVPFNDFPCLDMVLPVFSKRATEALDSFLAPNGEMLELDSAGGEYFLYNVTNVRDALDLEHSRCEFWCNPPTTAVDIAYFSFKKDELKNASIFRIYEMPMMLFVTGEFVSAVNSLGLNGFKFKKVWPLAEGVDWRAESFRDEVLRGTNYKKNTLAIIFPLKGKTPNKAELNQFSRLEDELDALLKVESLSDMFYGKYEGKDFVESELRMFISAPSVDALVSKLGSWFDALSWFGQIHVIKRYGSINDADAKEVVLI